MPITAEEKQYLTDGVTVLLKKPVFRNKALGYIQDNLSLSDIVSQLSAYIKKDFVAAASAAGIKTPSAAVAISQSDISQMQTFVGYTATPLSSDQLNIMDTLKATSERIDCVNTQAINSLHILGANNYKIIDNPKIVISCSFDGKIFSLGDVIAKADASVLGIQKAWFDCNDWATTKGDHYLTATEEVGGCSPLLLEAGTAFAECVKALGVSIN